MKNIPQKSLLLFLLLIPYLCIGQTQTKVLVSGLITNDKKEPIPYTNVLIQERDSIASIIGYAYSNEKGRYEIQVAKKGSFDLIISALGYEKKNVLIKIASTSKEVIKNVTLLESSFELSEVIIKADLPIKVREDTIIFNAKKFLKGNEIIVEDLLKNLPGVTVDDEGKIKVGSQEIEKLTIDGDNLFEKGYKILSKSLPVHPIETIELLKNYSNNRLLKGIEDSNKVAINLTLKEEAKNIWFGNVTVGYDTGLNNNYSVQGNLANFGKKNKYYFLTNLNNTGDDVTGDINQLVKPFRFNEPASIGDNQSVNILNNLSSSVPNFKQRRTNFNNAELASLNAIFNLNDKVKLKTLGFFNSDENDFFRNSIQNFTQNQTNFTNTEDFVLRKRKHTGFGKVDFIYNISKTKSFEATTKFNYTDTKDSSDLVFNTINTIQELGITNTLFDQKINYSNKFTDKKVFLLTGRYINERLPQNYSVNQFLFPELFPEITNGENVNQISENKYQYTGFEAHLLDRKKNGNLLELKIGNELRVDVLNTIFSINNQNTLLLQPNEFQNNLEYSTNDLYIKSKYLFKVKKLEFILNLGFHQLFNNLKYTTTETNESPFFINPKLEINWKINNDNKISASTSFNTTNANVISVTSNFALTGFRSFSQGTGDFNQLSSSTYSFNYQLGDWSDRFFVNASFSYNKDNDFFSTNTIISQNFSLSERIIINNREFFNVFTNVDYYFKPIRTNIKLNLGYSASNFKNIVNNSDLREVKSTNYNYELQLRSAFSGIFNYHVGTKWLSNKIETTIESSFTDNISFIDLTFIFNDKFNVDLESERYSFGNLDSNNIFYFLDVSAKYTIKKNKLDLFLDGRNLFNTKRFQNFSISDIGSSTTEFRLLPRFVLLKLQYRF
ncbi:carboxypeptidase-like regulatory domain-containing protein [Winogradskyella immobilis]|uniref:TonB-dependent receptor n=1 Tax=Winogradskyella immobilis TaxID=2816852 RepID=A0ABS8EMK5_9FLAO|nr:carboxypeptidase-like regulatory domain-containing protein [Winogradskyella immobilis]MCC1484426.1 TonB-dependent receptor [Winogradskyella immobilis]MCG0016518.1 carboxypeptidase-like regulatory domain-containing protein [Winogradskyella immobilis]